MKFYLCARYGRREELFKYALDLGAMGHTVTSRWVFTPDRFDNGSNLGDRETMAIHAEADAMDIAAADVFVCFTEELGSPFSRGGRHVEFGIAMTCSYFKMIAIVGTPENIFHCAPKVRWFEDWDDGLDNFKTLDTKS